MANRKLTTNTSPWGSFSKCIYPSDIFLTFFEESCKSNHLLDRLLASIWRFRAEFPYSLHWLEGGFCWNINASFNCWYCFVRSIEWSHILSMKLLHKYRIDTVSFLVMPSHANGRMIVAHVVRAWVHVGLTILGSIIHRYIVLGWFWHEKFIRNRRFSTWLNHLETRSIDFFWRSFTWTVGASSQYWL